MTEPRVSYLASDERNPNQAPNRRTTNSAHMRTGPINQPPNGNSIQPRGATIVASRASVEVGSANREVGVGADPVEAQLVGIEEEDVGSAHSESAPSW